MAIVADFSSGNTSAYTVAAHQFDKGQKLIVTGVELPETYEVHISNTKTGGFASAYVGNSNGVLIPDVYFTSGERRWEISRSIREEQFMRLRSRSSSVLLSCRSELSVRNRALLAILWMKTIL